MATIRKIGYVEKKDRDTRGIRPGEKKTTTKTSTATTPTATKTSSALPTATATGNNIDWERTKSNNPTFSEQDLATHSQLSSLERTQANSKRRSAGQPPIIISTSENTGGAGAKRIAEGGANRNEPGVKATVTPLNTPTNEDNAAIVLQGAMQKAREEGALETEKELIVLQGEMQKVREDEALHPGETEFQRERRITDELARERELQERTEDRRFFEILDLRRRELELKRREEDARFYAELEEAKTKAKNKDRKKEEKFWEDLAEEKENIKEQERVEDAQYYNEIARLNRERDLRERAEDAAYYAGLNRGGGGGSTSTNNPGPEVTLISKETERVWRGPSTLSFGLLATGGYWTEEEFEKSKKK